MNILNLLEVGSRKEVGESAEVAIILIESDQGIESFFDILIRNCNNARVVSHGTYALKEASMVDKEIAIKSVKFFFESINLFNQWEAKENFLRIILMRPEHNKLTKRNIELIESFLAGSSIVCAYSIEVLIVNCVLHRADNLKRYLDIGLSSEKAAVSARTRKVMKKYGLEILLD